MKFNYNFKIKYKEYSAVLNKGGKLNINILYFNYNNFLYIYFEFSDSIIKQTYN